MSDTRSESRRVPGLLRNRLHAGVCGDQEPDRRYAAANLSNLKKVEYICGVLNYPQAAFDLDLPLPIEDWLASDDLSIVSSGLYLSDLRTQFYGRILASDEEDLDKTDAWAKQGQAEWWQFRFNQLLNRRRSAAFIKDPRVLH